MGCSVIGPLSQWLGQICMSIISRSYYTPSSSVKSSKGHILHSDPENDNWNIYFMQHVVALRILATGKSWPDKNIDLFWKWMTVAMSELHIILKVAPQPSDNAQWWAVMCYLDYIVSGQFCIR